MAKVVDTANPHRVLYDGPVEGAKAFMQANEPRPHASEGRLVPQLKLVEDDENEES